MSWQENLQEVCDDLCNSSVSVDIIPSTQEAACIQQLFSVSSVSVGCVYCLAAPVLCLQGYVLISVTVNKCFPGSQDFHSVVGNEVVQH